MGDVKVSRRETADEAAHKLKRVDAVLGGVDEPRLIRDVVCESLVLFDADHIAMLFLNRFAHQFNQCLCLAGPFETHD